MTVNPEIVIIWEEVEKIGELFSDALAAKNIDWKYQVDDTEVYADKNQFIIITRNIVHDAIKFSSSGGHIHISSAHEDGEVCISVADAGMGMDMEVRARILKGQLHESTFGTAGESGAGIGLSFRHKLLKKNNGRLEIEDARPKGTVFKVWLPGVRS